MHPPSMREFLLLYAFASVGLLLTLLSTDYLDWRKNMQALQALCDQRGDWELKSLAAKTQSPMPLRIYSTSAEARMCVDALLVRLREELRRADQPAEPNPLAR